MVYDVIIIGSGPAGLTAAIYAARAGLTHLVLEKNAMSGGQMVLTDKIENYPGAEALDGFSLSLSMRSQAEKLGAAFETREVKELKRADGLWQVVTGAGEMLAKNVIYAGGASHKKLGLPSEARFAGRGVSYCATCDGNFYRGKTVLVNGGGNTAVQDALYLSNVAKKVYLVHRRDKFRAVPKTLEAARARENIEILTPYTVKELTGEKKVAGAVLAGAAGERRLELDGVFIAVGIEPASSLLAPHAELDAGGFIRTDEDCRAAEGLYAVGDVRAKKFRQIITAAADGAIAVESILENI